MSSDGSPILIDLLDSLTSINKRLNLIETALRVQEAEEGNGITGPPAAAGTCLPLSLDTLPQVVAQRYGQSPPPPYQPYTQSATPPLNSANTLLPIYHNRALITSAGWSSGKVPGITHTAAAGARRQPYTKRSSQLLRLKNIHAKDSVSDDGTEPEADTSDGDVHMKNSEEGGPYEAEDMDTDPAVKAEVSTGIPPEAHAYSGESQPTYAQSPAPNPAEHQPGPSATNANTNASNPTPAPLAAEGARLEALPEGFIVTGRATLQEELDSWTIPRGYSMRINGTRSHGRRQKIRMVCFRGGRSRLRPREEEQEEERQREELEAKKEKERELLELERRSQLDLNRGSGGGSGLPISSVALANRRRKPATDRVSKKCECPFRFELVEIGPGADEYTVHYTNDGHTQHNHAAADLMLDPRARKLPSALKAEVDQWLRGNGRNSRNGRSDQAGNGWTIAKIQAELQKRGYGHVLDFDLRNRKRALLHKERAAQQKGGQNDQEASVPGDSGKARSAGSVGESSASNTPTAS